MSRLATTTARTAVLAVTSATRMAREQPAHFTAQVSRRLGLHRSRRLAAATEKLPEPYQGRARQWLGLTATDANQSEAHELAALGQLSAAIASISSSRGFRSHLIGERDILQAPQLHLERLTPPSAAARPHPAVTALHYLTNSLPHTQSGYALRSQAVLKSQLAAGMRPWAVTRPGYPVTVGRLPRTDADVVDDITYERLLPWKLEPYGLRRLEQSAALLIAAARRVHPALLHTTTDFRNGLVVQAAAAELGLPWVYEVRGEPERTWLSRIPPALQAEAQHSEYYQLARSQEARVASQAGHVVALSEVSAQGLIARGVAPERITLVPNAVGENLLGRTYSRPDLRVRLGLPADAFLVGSVSAVVGYEGFDDLLRAVALLRSRGLNATAVIVGDGTAAPELQRLAAELRLSEHLIMPGRVPAADAWQWYAALDVFAVPRKDTLVCRSVTPIKPLAAQALGVPVVASDLPALREVTGGVAVYHAPEDPEDLADAIQRAHAQRKELAVTGREFAATRTWSANAAKYRELYEALLT